MRTTFALIGLLALAGAGLVMAAGSPQAATAGRRRVQPAAAQPAVQQPKPAPSPEEKAIIDGVKAFTKLYSAANAEALAELFLDDASIIDPDGNETRGKAAVAEMYAAAFQESPGLKVESKVDEVRFLTPDVARVDGRVATLVGHGRRDRSSPVQRPPGPA